MYFGGIDAPRTYLTLAVVDKSGEVVREKSRVPIKDGEPLLEALEGIRPLEVAVETCSFWPWICDTLQPIYELDGRIASAATQNPDALLLQTIPGIGSSWSLLLVGEITPIARFPSADHLVSLGQAPSTRSSGGTTRHGLNRPPPGTLATRCRSLRF